MMMMTPDPRRMPTDMSASRSIIMTSTRGESGRELKLPELMAVMDKGLGADEGAVA